MKTIQRTESILALENEIFDKKNKFPKMAFKENFDVFYFFVNDTIKYSDNNFNSKLFHFINDINSSKFYLSCLNQEHGYGVFEIEKDDPEECYSKAMSSENDFTSSALNVGCVDGIGIYCSQKKWGIYSEEYSELSVLGTYQIYKSACDHSFLNISLKKEEIVAEMKFAYKSTILEESVNELFSNYKI